MNLILALAAAICLTNGVLSIPLEKENTVKSDNSTLLEEAIRHKRSGYYPYYNYNNFNSYYYPYQTYVQSAFVAGSCGSYSCPAGCPGTCGTYGGLFACRCTQCAYVGDACNSYNINRGLYYHAYPLDRTRYVQCDRSGAFYIRSCANGLFYDGRYGGCGRSSYYYNHGK
jgi:hypothetical protein